eukprot:2598580-Rhodomonas_salina.1
MAASALCMAGQEVEDKRPDLRGFRGRGGSALIRIGGFAFRFGKGQKDLTSRNFSYRGRTPPFYGRGLCRWTQPAHTTRYLSTAHGVAREQHICNLSTGHHTVHYISVPDIL